MVNFKRKNSKYTINKNLLDFFEEKGKDKRIYFNQFIIDLNEQIRDINSFLNSNTDDKDFKPKNINLDTLISSVNQCSLFCYNKTNFDELIGGLSECYSKLAQRKKIRSNQESKEIITKFNYKLDNYINYINKIKGLTQINNMEEKKEKNIKQINKNEEKSEKELSEDKIKDNEKDKQSHEEKVNESKHEKMINALQKQIENLYEENKKNKELLIKDLNVKLKILDERVKTIENEYAFLKSSLSFSEKKIETLQTLLVKIRWYMNTMLKIWKNLTINLDEAFLILLDLDNKINTFGVELNDLNGLLG